MEGELALPGKKKKRPPATGGNGTVTFEDGCARKELRLDAGRERVKRFRAEVEILNTLKENGPRIDRVVPILDYQLSDKPYWYTMPALDGHLECVVHEYRGDVRKTVRALLPVIYALEKLSERDPAIFHRDIKPGNILHAGNGDQRELWVSDFGCAFLADPEAHRHTLDFRAVGAVDYRAPEYAHGRVETVTASGDVFSIGKLLWHMVNGVPCEVFPYTLWHPPEYDLSRRFPDNPLVDRLNLIIWRCVEYEPSKRPSYSGLIEQLESLLTTREDPEEVSLRDKLARQESRIQLGAVEARAHARVVRNIALADLKNAQAQLQPELQGLDPWKALLGKPTETTDHGLRQATDGPGTDTIFATSIRGLKVYAILYGPRAKKAPEGGQFPFVEMAVLRRDGRNLRIEIWEGNDGNLLQQKSFGTDERQTKPYEGNAALTLFRAVLQAAANGEILT